MFLPLMSHLVPDRQIRPFDFPRAAILNSSVGKQKKKGYMCGGAGGMAYFPEV